MSLGFDTVARGSEGQLTNLTLVVTFCFAITSVLGPGLVCRPPGYRKFLRSFVALVTDRQVCVGGTGITRTSQRRGPGLAKSGKAKPTKGLEEPRHCPRETPFYKADLISQGAG